MSEWLDQIENHQIHDGLRAALAPVKEILKGIRAKPESLEPEAVARIDRISFVLSECQRRLKRTDPYLISVQLLTNLQSPIKRIASQLSSYLSNDNTTHIQNACSELENVLASLGQVPSASSTEDMDAIQEAAIALRRSAGKHMSGVSEKGADALAKPRNSRETG